MYFYFSAIAIAHDSSFKTDQDILVLPLDVLKFDAHEKLTQDVLKHFGKVYSVFFLINVISQSRVLGCISLRKSLIGFLSPIGFLY